MAVGHLLVMLTVFVWSDIMATIAAVNNHTSYHKDTTHILHSYISLDKNGNAVWSLNISVAKLPITLSFVITTGSTMPNNNPYGTHPAYGHNIG